jgi:hypothetical protein
MLFKDEMVRYSLHIEVVISTDFKIDLIHRTNARKGTHATSTQVNDQTQVLAKGLIPRTS